MSPTAASKGKEWLTNRNRSRLNTNEDYQLNPGSYEYNEDVDINNFIYRERNEEENYNDCNFDGRKSALTSIAVHTCCSKNIKNLDNLIGHSQDEATHRDVKVSWKEKASSSKNKYAEKTTYCRPVLNVFRQDFIYKSLERNAKLQLLLKKLVITRRKEKEEMERAEWNNYVNKLKNTGHYLSNESRHIEPRHMELRHVESRYIEPRHIEPRHIEPRRTESSARIYFDRSKKSHEFSNNPNSKAIYDPAYRSLHEHEQEHTEPPRFNNHPEHKRVPVSTEPSARIYFDRSNKSHEFSNNPNSEAIYDPPYRSLHEHEQEHTEQPRFNNHTEHKSVPVSTEPSARIYFDRSNKSHEFSNNPNSEAIYDPPYRSLHEHEQEHTEPARFNNHTEHKRVPVSTEPSARIYFNRSNKSHEFSNNPNSKAIYNPPYRSLHEHEQEHTEPPRFNNHPEHKRVPVSPGFESGLENGPSFPITSSIDRLVALANVWQLSTPHTIAEDRSRSHSRTSIPVDSGKYKDDRQGHCERWKTLAIKKEDESSRESNPATTTGGLCKTYPLANRKEESSRETNPATTTGSYSKACLLANRKEESTREINPATATGSYSKACLLANMKEESSRETNPATTTGGYFKACLLANRKKEESLRETNPATNTGGLYKTCPLANRKEESSRETNPATTTGSYCKACLLANRKEESLRETNPATTTGSYFKACLLASRKKEESLRETNPATTTGCLCKTCPLANRTEESSREIKLATTTGGYCKACFLANRKEESSRETNPANTMGGYCIACLYANRKENESSRETNPATTTGCYCKACLLASGKEGKSSRETYPAITTDGSCKMYFLANRKEERSRETYPATTKSGYCKACLLANRKEESSRETYPATTTGSYSKACLLANMKEEERSREKYPATIKSGYCKACVHANRKEEESSWQTNFTRIQSIKINVATQTTSVENTNIDFIITDQVTPKEKCEEITQNCNSLSGLETKMELLANSIKAMLSKLESVKEVQDTSTACCSGVCENIAKSTSVSCVNVDVENMPKATTTACDCDEVCDLPEQSEQQQRQPKRPGHPMDTFNLQTENVVRPLPTKYRNISSSTSKIDKIMCEELVKSNQLRKDIEDILCQSNSPCAVQISFDIPTRERCTEVTDSLATTKLMEEQEISIQEFSLSGDENRQMTIAVNTDPLGLLAWFRMSSDTLKQLISYVPTVDYSRYLLRAPLPQLTTAAVDFVCNICGACFTRPSLLNNHIRTHDLTDSRNCCICHHVLNIKPRSTRTASRFACRYCGQRFTRAYCCELHEQSCARALGRSHDVTSGHGLLT